MEILKRILTLLDMKGQKQKDFCIATHISEKTFSTWKSRNTNPPADKLSSIADFFQITIDELVTGKAPENGFDSLSEDEQDLMRNYRHLDNRGRHKLHTVLYEELDRIELPTTQGEISSSGSHSTSDDIA